MEHMYLCSGRRTLFLDRKFMIVVKIMYEMEVDRCMNDECVWELGEIQMHLIMETGDDMCTMIIAFIGSAPL